MNLAIWTVPAAFGGGLLLTAGVGAAELSKVWQLDGLAAPESVVLDAGAGVFYVSNINGEAAAADGNGYISKVSSAGEMVEQEWVTGLDAPKGLALKDGKLYVADIDQLVVIDVASGGVAARHKAEGATFLNDVSAAADGRIFVSDTLQNQIWQLEGDSFTLWLEDPALESPNGLLAESDRLVVASWGAGGFEAKVPGHPKAVDYASKQIEDLGDGGPVGNLDGLESDGAGGYLATDWVTGRLYRLDAKGDDAQVLIELGQGSADLEYVADEKLALIPLMMQGAVAAYKVE